MATDLTVGDDSIAPCPHCREKIDISYLRRESNLHPGSVGTCGLCNKEFEVDEVEYVPNVWLRKYEPN